MSKVAAHVKTARKLGAQAGLQQLYETLARNTNGGTNGLPQAREMLAEIEQVGKVTSKGTFRAPKRAIAWYCNHFANVLPQNLPPVIEPTRKRVTRKNDAQETQEPTNPTTTTTTDVNALLTAAIQAGATPEQLTAIVGAASGTTTEGVFEDEADLDDDDDGDDDDENGDDDGTEVIQGTRVRRVTRQGDTGTGYPAPRDPDANATNGKLWTLNTEGPEFGYFLVVVDSDMNIVAGGDEPLKNGECHELIAEIRA